MFRALLLFTAAALADPNHHAPEGSTWFCLRFIQKLTEHDEVVHTLPAAAAPTKAIVDKLSGISATDISYGVFVKGLPNTNRLAVIDADRTPHALIRDGKMLGIMFDVGTDATHRFAYHRRINHYWTILKFQLPDDNKFWNDNFRKTFLKDLMTPFEIKNFVDGFAAENDLHCDTLPKVTEGDSKQNAAIKSLSSKVYPVKNIISFYANADFKKTSIGKFTALWDHFKADIECPDEIWSDFGEFGQCSKSCGGGIKSKSRTCYMGNPGDEGCPGSDIISATCNPQACSFYDQWSSWGDCSVTCGTGTRSQVQICNRGSGDKDCEGQAPTVVEACSAPACAPDILMMIENEDISSTMKENNKINVVKRINPNSGWSHLVANHPVNNLGITKFEVKLVNVGSVNLYYNGLQFGISSSETPVLDGSSNQLNAALFNVHTSYSGLLRMNNEQLTRFLSELNPWRDGDYAGVVVDATTSPNQIHWYHNDILLHTTDLPFEITSDTYPTVGMFRNFEVEINFVGPFIMDNPTGAQNGAQGGT